MEEEFDPELLKKLVDSMPKHYIRVIESNGDLLVSDRILLCFFQMNNVSCFYINSHEHSIFGVWIL